MTRPRRKKRPWWERKLLIPLRGWWYEWSPRMCYRKLRWFLQRGTRGWADRDIWGLDSYIAEWMPAALRHLKATGQGVPHSMFTKPELAEMERGGIGDVEAASARWNATLDKMILGFDAYTRMQEGLYEEELGPYVMADGPEADAQSAQRRELHERDETIWKEGIALFVEHFQSLWD